MAALFTTEAQLRAWLLVPEHEIGNTGVTEPPLLKRAHEIMKKTAEGLVSPVLEGDRVRSSCKGSDKDSVYELSVHVRDKESIDCQCTCPFAKNPNSAVPTGACKHTVALLLWHIQQLGGNIPPAAAGPARAAGGTVADAPRLQNAPQAGDGGGAGAGGGPPRPRRKFAGLEKVANAVGGVAAQAAPPPDADEAAPKKPRRTKATPAPKAPTGTGGAAATMPAAAHGPTEEEQLQWLQTASDDFLVAEARRIIAAHPAAPAVPAVRAPALPPPAPLNAVATGGSQPAPMRTVQAVVAPPEAPAAVPAPAVQNNPPPLVVPPPAPPPVPKMFNDDGSFDPSFLMMPSGSWTAAPATVAPPTVAPPPPAPLWRPPVPPASLPAPPWASQPPPAWAAAPSWAPQQPAPFPVQPFLPPLPPLPSSLSSPPPELSNEPSTGKRTLTLSELEAMLL